MGGREEGREGEESGREGGRMDERVFIKVSSLLGSFNSTLPFSHRTGPITKTHPESKCPELLANYCDMLLRKTPLSKKLTSEETEGKLKDVVRKFRSLCVLSM